MGGTGPGTAPGRDPHHEQHSAGYAARLGAVSALLALATAELLAAALGVGVSPLEAVGAAVIDATPPAVEDAAIQLFATADKLVLVGGILAVAVAAGAALGLVAERSLAAAAVGFLLFAAGGGVAVAVDPRAAAAGGWASTVAAAAIGVATLARGRGVTAPRVDAASRRRFLGMAALATVAAGGATFVLRRAALANRVVAARQAVDLPAPGSPARAGDFDVGVAGVSAFATPVASFYRIDTALSVPRVDLEGWRLRVHGLVDRELVFTYDDLLRLADTEAWITLCCVSNEVGGGLIGNARWQGVPLRHLLDLAGVQLGAEQVVGRAVDGWTGAFPTQAALDGRDALVALGMNGEPLPLVHGFPARLVVPGLYGYVSATKWLSEIELTTREFDGYWIPRGWAKDGPVKTSSRIDVPRAGQRLTPGRQPVAGVAWAQRRGVEAVEVSVDEGPWQAARLADVPNVDTWRQWVFAWEATPGRHSLRARAVDATGAVQDARRRPPRPDGATGLHTVEVVVEEQS